MRCEWVQYKRTLKLFNEKPLFVLVYYRKAALCNCHEGIDIPRLVRLSASLQAGIAVFLLLCLGSRPQALLRVGQLADMSVQGMAMVQKEISLPNEVPRKGNGGNRTSPVTSSTLYGTRASGILAA